MFAIGETTIKSLDHTHKMIATPQCAIERANKSLNQNMQGYYSQVEIIDNKILGGRKPTDSNKPGFLISHVWNFRV